ncbi:DUF4157 domain-containing protein [Streptomyces graminilatus]|uniref:eCIS core domain-containing protein n=1 Tax=Streptomyces graminilatus TaxID=1464070 RepID=UPI001F51DDD0|nr:DUF4157 domain-containing protein [Streptomyces graminilatus]
MASLTPETVLALQRTIGNAVVARLVEQHRHAQDDAHREARERDARVEVQRSTVHQVLRSPGRRLAEPLRTEMEARLGADFTGVRIHDDTVAQRSATELGARAYTSGNHVVIGRNGTDKHTLAHELTHVIQQRQGPVAGTDHGDGTRVSDPGDRFERAAEANAHAVMSRPVVQREAETAPTRTPAGTPHDATQSMIQRSIFIGGEKLDWQKAGQKLKEEQGADRFGNAEKLDFILRYLDSVNYKSLGTAQLFGAVNNLYRELDRFAVDSVNPKDWAVLHRLRGGATKQGFDDFLKQRGISGDEVVKQKEGYMAAGAKYNPVDYGGKHTWKGNEKWLEDVSGRKFVLTDVPLRKSNILRKLTAEGQPTTDHEKSHAGQVSAYGREIAYALAQGYLPLWSDRLNAKGAAQDAGSLPVFVMAPPGKVGPMASGTRPQFVDEDYMAEIAREGIVWDDGKRLLEAFRLAGLPTVLDTTPEAHQAAVEAKHAERAEMIKRREKSEEARKQKEEKSEEANSKRKQEAAQTSEVLDSVGLTKWLAERLAAEGCTRSKFNPTGDKLGMIVSEAIECGLVGGRYSRNSLKDYIKTHVRNLLPEKS